jgi:hypothetical protein
MLLGWLLPSCFAFVLELLVIYYLAKGPRKRFPFVFVFCAIQVLAVTADTFFSTVLGARTHVYPRVYWAGDLIAHGAILLLILSLIWQSLEQRTDRRKAIGVLGLAVISFALFSAYTFHDPNLNRWMTSLSRNLSFGEEILNMILWALLIQRRASDYLLLMVSAGIGVQVTGEAIGHTLRLYARSATLWVPNLLVYLAEILCLSIWIWAFRSAGKKRVVLEQPVRTGASGTST